MKTNEPMKVMIVQTDPEDASSAARTLHEAGHVPVVVANIRQSRDVALRERPDVVLCDLDLPDRFAIALLVFLKALDERIEVVFSTRGSPLNLVLEAIHDGAADFLERPLAGERLLATLEEAARDGRTSAPAHERFHTALLLGRDDSALRALVNQLGELGIAVCTAADADEALGINEERIIDLLMVDVSGIQEDCLELVRHVKDARPDVLVIALGGFQGPASIIESFRAGAFSVHIKPLGREALHRAVLAARRARRAPPGAAPQQPAKTEELDHAASSRVADLAREVAVLAEENAALAQRAVALEEERDAAAAAVAELETRLDGMRQERDAALTNMARQAAQDTPAAPAPEAVATQEPGPMVVLIASVESGAGGYKHELARAGFTVRWYLDPVHALSSLKDDQPRTVVMDSAMVAAAGVDSIRSAFAETLVPSLVLLDENDASNALRASAEVPRNEVLASGAAPNELIDAVRRGAGG